MLLLFLFLSDSIIPLVIFDDKFLATSRLFRTAFKMFNVMFSKILHVLSTGLTAYK